MLTLRATQTRGDKLAIIELRAIAIREVDDSGLLNKVLQATSCHPYTHLGISGSLLGARGLFRYSTHHHHRSGHLQQAQNSPKTWHVGRETATQKERGGVTAREQRVRL